MLSSLVEGLPRGRATGGSLGRTYVRCALPDVIGCVVEGSTSLRPEGARIARTTER